MDRSGKYIGERAGFCVGGRILRLCAVLPALLGARYAVFAAYSRLKYPLLCDKLQLRGIRDQIWEKDYVLLFAGSDHDL